MPASDDLQSPARTEALAQAIAIMARLRAPGGCPWDREQTFDSIKRHTLEETYEVFDAIERRAWPDLQEELGDLLLQVLFYAQMAEEAGHFTLEEVAATLNAKLIRRHPHIFSTATAATPEEVKRTWEAVKQTEKAARGEQPKAFLDDVPHHQPALLEAHKLGHKAAKVGFDWPNLTGLLDKLAEETDELRAEIDRKELNRDAVEEELGDLLFTVVNLARHLHLEPEFALRKANRKFRARFTAMEAAAGLEALQKADSAELDRLWRQAKLNVSAAEATTADGSPPRNSSPAPA